MKILLASDGSECSDRAAQYLVKTLKGTVKLLKVTLFYVDVPMLDRVAAALGESRVAQIHRENADDNLAPARKRLRRARVDFDEASYAGNVAECIAMKAETGGYDLVVMGSHGRTPFKNVLLGSVTARVLAACKVPVLIVS